MIWENGIETCILSCKNRITSLCPMQDTACLGLVHALKGNARGEGGNKDVSQTQGMAGKDISFTRRRSADLS